MASRAPIFRITAIDCFERAVGYRMPFRFGAATVAKGTQAYVRAHIRLDDGREADGASAELMVPKWFDKDPTLDNDDNVAQLRSSLALARSAYLGGATSLTAFGHFAAHVDECRREAERQRLPALAGAFGAAEIDKAVLDALCRALGVSFFDAVAHDAIGFVPSSVAPDIRGAGPPQAANSAPSGGLGVHIALDAAAFLASLASRPALAIRHTVGLADPLTGHPNAAGDGLPESLEEAIAAYGLRWFKLKLSGELASDLERLRAVARVLDALPDYRVTLDGNEQYAVEALRSLFDVLRADRSLQRLAAAIAFVEQPLPRQLTFDEDVHELALCFPLLIDEADATLDAFPRARALGYTGVSSKSCKGLYKSLLNAMRCAEWTDATRKAPYFLSGEDLTTPAGLAVQQDLALASLLGLSHVERNGHHYIDGMAGAPTDEQRAFLDAHPDLYERSRGAVRLKIRDGAIAIASLACKGFASGAHPDWNALAPMKT